MAPKLNLIANDLGQEYWTHFARLLVVLRVCARVSEGPTLEERARLDDAFDTLIDQETGYAASDERVIIKTADKRGQRQASPQIQATLYRLRWYRRIPLTSHSYH